MRAPGSGVSHADAAEFSGRTIGLVRVFCFLVKLGLKVEFLCLLGYLYGRVDLGLQVGTGRAVFAVEPERGSSENKNQHNADDKRHYQGVERFRIHALMLTQRKLGDEPLIEFINQEPPDGFYWFVARQSKTIANNPYRSRPQFELIGEPRHRSG